MTESTRRKSVEIAIADSLIDFIPSPEQWELEIYEAFIRGEIQAPDLVDTVKNGLANNWHDRTHATPA